MFYFNESKHQQWNMQSSCQIFISTTTHAELVDTTSHWQALPLHGMPGWAQRDTRPSNYYFGGVSAGPLVQYSYLLHDARSVSAVVVGVVDVVAATLVPVRSA